MLVEYFYFYFDQILIIGLIAVLTLNFHKVAILAS